MIYNKVEKKSSLKALKELKENAQEVCEWELDRLNIIEKDLELLDILKKHYNINSLTVSLDSFISITINKTDKDFEKIKDWLENDKSFYKSTYER